MKVQILVGGEVVNTQIVSEMLNEKASSLDFKRIALKAALDDNAIKLSDALRATFRLYDMTGKRFDG